MKKTWLFIACIVGCAVSVVVLLQLIPPLFNSNEEANVRVLAMALSAGLVFTVGMRHLKPPLLLADDDK